MDAMDAERRKRFVAYFEGPPLHGDRAKLMQKTGYTKGRVNHFLDTDQPFGQKAAANLATRLGLHADAFERQAHPQRSDDPAHQVVDLRPVAHDLSHAEVDTAPTTLEWEQTLNDKLPVRFRLKIRDDSMYSSEGEGLAPGDFAIFDRSRAPKAGKNVLCRDGRGNVFLRRYLPRTPGHWIAEARNRAYQPLDSIADSLTIIAPQIGFEEAA